MSLPAPTTPTTRTPNPYEAVARLRKAIQLADAIDAAGVTGDQASQGGGEFWEAAADQAGVQPPSEKTRIEVVELLKERERARQKHHDRYRNDGEQRQ